MHGGDEAAGLVDTGEVAAAEIGLALRLSHRSAGGRLGLALLLQGLPRVAGALGRAELSLATVRIIVEAVTDLSPEQASAVQERVLPRAADQTPADLGASVARAVLAVDPLRG